MQANGNAIVDTVCHTAERGVTLTSVAENGDVTVIEAEPVEPINEYLTCGQPGVFRDHANRACSWEWRTSIPQQPGRPGPEQMLQRHPSNQGFC